MNKAKKSLTVVIDPQLLKAVKVQAAVKGETLKEIVERLFRAFLGGK